MQHLLTDAELRELQTSKRRYEKTRAALWGLQALLKDYDSEDPDTAAILAQVVVMDCAIWG